MALIGNYLVNDDSYPLHVIYHTYFGLFTYVINHPVSRQGEYYAHVL